MKYLINKYAELNTTLEPLITETDFDRILGTKEEILITKIKAPDRCEDTMPTSLDITPTPYITPPIGRQVMITRIEEKAHHRGSFVIYSDKDNNVGYFITDHEAKIFLANAVIEEDES